MDSGVLTSLVFVIPELPRVDALVVLLQRAMGVAGVAVDDIADGGEPSRRPLDLGVSPCRRE